MTTETRRGGVVLRVDGALAFVPASIALRLAALPPIARVPGAPPDLLGITLESGHILPVIAIGSYLPQHVPSSPSMRPDETSKPLSMIVCSYLGEELGLVGAEIVHTGTFDIDATGDAVRVGDEVARTLDLAALYARVQAGPWAGRWRG